MHQGEGQGGQLPHPILADQKAPPGSGGAPHYYLPPWIFDPWCIPVQKVLCDTILMQYDTILLFQGNLGSFKLVC